MELASKKTWVPTSDEERNRVLAELERVLETQVFQRSERYSAFLRHVVERTLEGRSTDLKERLIGIEVFHRSADYDTASDPVVRFCAGEVRKRLAQYYRRADGSQIEIELPIGTYIPYFRIRTKNTAFAERASSPSNHDSVSFAAPVSDQLESHPLSVETRSLRRPSGRIVVIAALSAIVICLLAGLFRWMHHPPIESVWAPFLHRGQAVNICTGSPPPEGGVSDDAQAGSIEQHFLHSGHRVSMATAATIADLSGFLEAHNQPYDLSEATTVTLDNLHGKPLILINANNNPWTLLMLKPLRFHFDFPEPHGSITDRDHPERHDWTVDFNEPYKQENQDFAIVAKFFDQTIEAPVLVLAGISSNGTKAAGDFIVSPQYIEQLAKGAPRGWEKMNFEAVLKVEVVQGHMGEIQIVSKTFW